VSKTPSPDLDGLGIGAEQWGDVPRPPRRTKPPGSGRQKGTRNKKTVERAKLLAELKVDGTDPVSFFASILKNDTAPLDLRFAAAKELAPFVHPKLASVESRPGGKSHEDRLEELQSMLSDEGGYP
jgi:hypothetical protein